MNSTLNAGVWMDHLQAKIIIDGKRPRMACVIRSISEGRLLRVPGEEPAGVRLGNGRSSNDEYHRHNMAREELKGYFKELAKALLPFETIFIFGPTQAQDEFFHFLMRDKQFDRKQIFVKRTNYMTDNQIAETVKDFFHPLWRIPRMPKAYKAAGYGERNRG